MSEICFSVIIPLHQKKDGIQRAINSVLLQTYSSFELIVIDDGSTDGGPELVMDFVDKRIKLIRQKHQGVSVARNVGINAAKNEYVAFLDADDEWTPSFLDRIAFLINLYPDCGWYSTGSAMETDGLIRTEQNPLPQGIYHNYFQIAFQYRVVNSSDVVVPIQIAKEVGGFPVGVIAGQDLIMWIKIASKYPFAHIPEVCSIYHFSEKNIYKRILPSEPDIFFDYLDENNNSKNEFLAAQAIHRGILHSIYGNKKLAKLIEKNYAFTKENVKQYKKLVLYNKIPTFLLRFYYGLLSILLRFYRKINPKK